jgi:hypothetical protein
MVQMLQTVVSIINDRCICSKSAANALFQVVILCDSSQPKSQRALRTPALFLHRFTGNYQPVPLLPRRNPRLSPSLPPKEQQPTAIDGTAVLALRTIYVFSKFVNPQGLITDPDHRLPRRDSFPQKRTPPESS